MRILELIVKPIVRVFIETVGAKVSLGQNLLPLLLIEVDDAAQILVHCPAPQALTELRIFTAAVGPLERPSCPHPQCTFNL